LEDAIPLNVIELTYYFTYMELKQDILKCKNGNEYRKTL